jgi:hypothetical protein
MHGSPLAAAGASYSLTPVEAHGKSEIRLEPLSTGSFTYEALGAEGPTRAAQEESGS